MRKIFSFSFLFIVAVIGLFVPYVGLLLLVMMASIMILGLFKGRMFCGRVCPHGYIFDNVVVRFSRNKDIPIALRGLLISVLYFIFFMGMFVSVIFRSTQADNFILAFSYALSTMYLTVTIVSVTVGLIFAPRTFCHFCPQGSIQNIMALSGKAINKKTKKRVTLIDEEACIKCRLCNKSCPMHIEVIDKIISKDNHKLYDRKCIKCGVCIDKCPKDVLKLG